jgi:hypothetical protein
MKLVYVLVFFVVFALPFATFAKGKSTNIKGGIGFVFPDVNNFGNTPAARGMTDGANLQAAWSMASTVQQGDASFVWGKKGFGFGGYYNRTGTNLFATGTFDTVGGQIGFDVKDSFSFGVGYDYSLGAASTTNGTVTAALSIHGKKGQGANLTLGGTYTLQKVGAATMTAFAGFGWSMKNNLMLELDAIFNSFTNFSNFTGSAYVTYSGQTVYLSLGPTYYNMGLLGVTSDKIQLDGRLGFNLGSHFDISGTVGYIVRTANQLSYGATLRVGF